VSGSSRLSSSSQVGRPVTEFAQHQPITPITETVRGLLLGTGAGSYAWQALAWCGAITAVSIAASSVLFQRRITR
jgi:ABC-2 type transport system permease protein